MLNSWSGRRLLPTAKITPFLLYKEGLKEGSRTESAPSLFLMAVQLRA